MISRVISYVCVVWHIVRGWGTSRCPSAEAANESMPEGLLFPHAHDGAHDNLSARAPVFHVVPRWECEPHLLAVINEALCKLSAHFSKTCKDQRAKHICPL